MMRSLQVGSPPKDKILVNDAQNRSKNERFAGSDAVLSAGMLVRPARTPTMIRAMTIISSRT